MYATVDRYLAIATACHLHGDIRGKWLWLDLAYAEARRLKVPKEILWDLGAMVERLNVELCTNPETRPLARR